mmetsp:Transcript_8748/g.15892  ORF Transcript_8748/g.15892 Transcript_8748/m.15892 type:complete len:452 (-) Transcript_8748:220-1575(-)
MSSSAADYPYQIALFILQKMSCFASALGSLMIISQVCRSEFNCKKTQQRLILGISIIDFQTSIVWMLTSFSMPSESGAVLATGNQSTCNAQGFVVQFSTAGILYMCALQLQYLLVVKYRWGEKRLLRVEKWFHLVPILFGAGTATAALVLKQYNAANWDCWIAPSPQDCTPSYQVNKGGTDLTETDCVRGNNAEIYRWAFFFGPLWASIIFCIIVMILIYRSVRKTEMKSTKWKFKAWASFSNRHDENGNDGRNKSNRRPSNRRPSDRRPSVTDEVKKQSFRYSFAFLIVWIFPTIARLIQLFGGSIHPIFSVLAGTFIGSQGFFNALIYFRPRYNQCVEYDTWHRKVWALVHSTLFFCCYYGDYTKDAKDCVNVKISQHVSAGDAAQNNLTVCGRVGNGDCDDEEKQEEKEEDYVPGSTLFDDGDTSNNTSPSELRQKDQQNPPPDSERQ